MNPQDSISYLRRHPFFSEINKEGIKTISSQLRPIDIKKGNILFFQGDPPKSVYLIRSGFIKSSRITPEGRELTFYIFKENDLFGETAVLNNSPNDTTTEAFTDCLLYQIHVNNFLEILGNNPLFAMKVSSIMSNRLVKLEEKFQIAVSCDISSRIASTLLDLAEAFGVNSKEGVVITLPLTHLEIASLIGSTRETTCVTLNKFRRNGWIQSEKRSMTLLNLKVLRSLCET
jgi:CRP/FNR family transcriptional regulator